MRPVLRLLSLSFATAVVISAGCASASDVEGDDDFSDLGGAVAKPDAFSYRWERAGSITYGGQLNVQYTSSPRYRYVTFDGTNGDHVRFEVANSDEHDEHPMAWLLDSSYRVISHSEGDENNWVAGDTTLARSGKFYIVFREENLRPIEMTVMLELW